MKQIKLLEAVRRVKLKAAVGSGAVRQTGDALEVCIISEGPGNSRDGHYYTGPAIESGVAVFDGAKAFMDHPSADEEQSRPERSGRDIVGFYRNPRVVVEADGRKALYATFELARPEDPSKESDIIKQTRGLTETALRHAQTYGAANPFFGISINADGEEAAAMIDGQQYRAVTRFLAATSADLVTFPAARGRFVGDLASVREAVRAGKMREARAMKRKIESETSKRVRAALKKMASTDDAEARAMLAAEVEGYLKATEDAENAMKPNGDELPEDTAEAKAKAETEARAKAAAEAKAAEEAANRAAEEAKAGEGDGEAEESANAKAGALRESAKIVRATKPELADALEAQATALESRGGQFAQKNARIRQLEAEVRSLRSGVTARRLLAESDIPAHILSEKHLTGLSEAEQRREIGLVSRILEAARTEGAEVRSLVEGIGGRVPAAPQTNADELLARHGIPTRS